MPRHVRLVSRRTSSLHSRKSPSQGRFEAAETDSEVGGFRLLQVGRTVRKFGGRGVDLPIDDIPELFWTDFHL
jgi:hypothetical protein